MSCAECNGKIILDPSSEALVERIARVISREGGDPDNAIHSWRCNYPERYGKCDCVDDLARTIVTEALAGNGTPGDPS